MNIILAIVIFSLIILFHELGHFLLAKINKIRVREFTLGLGPTIVGFTKGETKYCLKLLPFGGSCVMDEDLEAEAADDRAFNNKNVWQRLSVVAAGPVFNFIMAFIFSLIIILIIGYDRPIVNYVEENSAAFDAGLEQGDIIKRVNGKKVRLSREVSFEQDINPSKTLELLVERVEDGEAVEKTIVVEPDMEEKYQIGIYIESDSTSIYGFTEGSPAEASDLMSGDEIVAVNGVDVETDTDIVNAIEESDGNELLFSIVRDGEEQDISVTPEFTTIYSHGFYTDTNLSREKNGIFKAIEYSFYEVGYWIKTTIKSLKMLVTGQVGFDQMSGPVGIVSVIGETYTESKQDGWLYVFLNMTNLAILLSANLGVMNLLPIPALDGGRIIFFLIEGITGKRLPQKVEGIIHMSGFALLMLLMIFVVFNDIRKIFS